MKWRLATMLLASMFCSSAAYCRDISTLAADANKELSRSILTNGLNCPTVVGMENVEENGRGHIFRVKCQSKDKKSEWSLRYILKSNGTDAVELW